MMLNDFQGFAKQKHDFQGFVPFPVANNFCKFEETLIWGPVLPNLQASNRSNAAAIDQPDGFFLGEWFQGQLKKRFSNFQHVPTGEWFQGCLDWGILGGPKTQRKPPASASLCTRALLRPEREVRVPKKGAHLSFGMRKIGRSQVLQKFSNHIILNHIHFFQAFYGLCLSFFSDEKHTSCSKRHQASTSCGRISCSTGRGLLRRWRSNLCAPEARWPGKLRKETDIVHGQMFCIFFVFCCDKIWSTSWTWCWRELSNLSSFFTIIVCLYNYNASSLLLICELKNDVEC